MRKKIAYDDMMLYMEGERRMIKEDRVKIYAENKKIMRDFDRINLENKDCYATINNVLEEFDGLASRYIKTRIELLQLISPDIKNASSSLYKIQDLINLKKRGEMDAATFLKEIDTIFDQLAST